MVGLFLGLVLERQSSAACGMEVRRSRQFVTWVLVETLGVTLCVSVDAVEEVYLGRQFHENMQLGIV